MKKVIVMIALMVGFSANAAAGEHATRLSQCLSANTTEADKAVLTRWVFSTLSKHPNLASNPNMNDLVSVARDIRSGADREMAQLVEKFIYDKCNEELKAAVKNEGPAAIQTSLRGYVEQTGRDILNHPSITGSVAGIATQMDFSKMLQALMAQ